MSKSNYTLASNRIIPSRKGSIFDRFMGRRQSQVLKKEAPVVEAEKLRTSSVAIESSKDQRGSTQRLSSMTFEKNGTQVISPNSNSKSSMHHIIPKTQGSLDIHSDASFLKQNVPDLTNNKYNEVFNSFFNQNQKDERESLHGPGSVIRDSTMVVVPEGMVTLDNELAGIESFRDTRLRTNSMGTANHLRGYQEPNASEGSYNKPILYEKSIDQTYMGSNYMFENSMTRDPVGLGGKDFEQDSRHDLYQSFESE